MAGVGRLLPILRRNCTLQQFTGALNRGADTRCQARGLRGLGSRHHRHRPRTVKLEYYDYTRHRAFPVILDAAIGTKPAEGPEV